MESVKQAVFELIAREQDFEQLQLESETHITVDNAEKQVSDLCLRKAIEEQAQASRTELSLLAPSIIAKRLHNVIGRGTKPLLLPKEQRVRFSLSLFLKEPLNWCNLVTFFH